MERRDEEVLEVALIDVGHGNCAVVSSGGRALVFDCPPGVAHLEFLRSKGIYEISHLVISHWDQDHSGGIAAMFAAGFRVANIWMVQDQNNDTMHYARAAELLRQARKAGGRIPQHVVHSYHRDLVWGRVRVEWLLPHSEDRMVRGNRNTLSIVCRLVADDRGAVVFLGDLDWRGYSELELSRDLDAQWLVVSHHGGLAGTKSQGMRLLKDLLERTRADFAFFSFSRDKFLLPRPELIKVAIETSGEGSVRCSQVSRHCAESLDNGVGRACGETATSVHSKACAGTVVLSVDDGNLIWLEAAAHEAFTRALPSALCVASTKTGGDSGR